MNQIEQALKILQKGGVIAYPTDTTYGIGCDVSDVAAISKIFEIKGRDFQKPLSIACSSLEMLAQYAEIDQTKKDFLEHIFPGPVTLLLYKTDLVSDVITSGSHKVGVRIPNHPEILELIEKLGRPIITTSANLSGDTDPLTADAVKLAVDFVFRGDCRHKQPSTIIDVENRKIVRAGVDAILYQNLLDKLVNTLS